MSILRKRDAGRRQITYINVSDIKPNEDQPRLHFDKEKLQNLAASIEKYGVIQPLTLRKADGQLRLIAGERRLRAAKMAGLYEVPCIIMEADELNSAVLALAENLHRDGLDFIEEAVGIYQMTQKYGLTREQAAEKLGYSVSAITNKLRILKLPGELLFIIRENGLTERHARALLRLDDNGDRIRVLDRVINRKLTVGQTEQLIEDFLREKRGAASKNTAPSYVIRDIRLFLNTVTHGMDIMKKSGIDAVYGKNETDNHIILTIKIPKSAEGSVPKEMAEAAAAAQ